MLKNSKIKNFYANHSRGFTLVEALVAITILIIGVIGPLQIAARGIGDGIFAANQIAANYLAQEAMELVVNKRYELARKYQYTELTGNFFQQDPGFQACLSGDSGTFCQVNPLTGDIDPNCTTGGQLTPNDSCKLRFNKANGNGLYELYDANSTNQIGTIFTRSIQMSEVSSEILKVTVTVTWFNKDIAKTLTLVEYLFSKG
ncbi:MAG: prepilin-type N-terminal cleavage/methylation domain-containing protein [Patescibacteria group bacterium]